MSNAQQFAFVEVSDGSEKPHLRILMGHGRIEVGNAVHEGLPALWFGNDGQGLGFERERNEPAKQNETVLVITFENLAGLEAIEFALARVRKSMEAKAAERDTLTADLFAGLTLSDEERGAS